jgi:ATP-dependent RNA helicase DeaD
MADALLQQRDPRDIAAAFVKLYRAQLPVPEDIEEQGGHQERVPAKHHAPQNTRGPQAEHRPQKPREHTKPDRPPQPRDNAPRGAGPSGMANGVWFRLNVGRGRNADPKWLLPEICRQGEVTKKDVGAIRVFDMETLFQVDASVAERFAVLVNERKKGGVRITPALNQTGESTAPPMPTQGDETPSPAPHKPAFKGKFKPKNKYKGNKPRP